MSDDPAEVLDLLDGFVPSDLLDFARPPWLEQQGSRYHQPSPGELFGVGDWLDAAIADAVGSGAGSGLGGALDGLSRR